MEICGRDLRSNMTLLYYVTPAKDINIALCVHECPNKTGSSVPKFKSGRQASGGSVDTLESEICLYK